MIKFIYLFSFLLISLSVGKVVIRVESFLEHELVPDILSSPPAELLSVVFPNGIQALEGNKLSPDEVRGTPALEWNAVNPEHFYTIIMCDPDAPSRVAARDRSFLHWLVVNVPGDDVSSGNTIVPIINSHPEPDTGFHRYVFLVYEQPQEIKFDELPDESFEGRKGFSPEKFADKYNFGAPVAGNFYQTETIDDNYEYIEN